MAHPKRRQGKTRTAKRRTHDKAVAPTMAICPNCGAWHIYHTVCGECGYYRGKLAIEKEAAKKNLIANILVEVNVAEEESKFGMKMEEVIPFVEKVSAFPHVRVRGLMTIAPFVEDPEENRSIFADLHKLYIDIKKKNHDNDTVSVLSMGMTNDYEVAIEEGATMVRIGTGIFGARNYAV